MLLILALISDTIIRKSHTVVFQGNTWCCVAAEQSKKDTTLGMIRILILMLQCNIMPQLNNKYMLLLFFFFKIINDEQQLIVLFFFPQVLLLNELLKETSYRGKAKPVLFIMLFLNVFKVGLEINFRL